MIILCSELQAKDFLSIDNNIQELSVEFLNINNMNCWIQKVQKDNKILKFEDVYIFQKSQNCKTTNKQHKFFQDNNDYTICFYCESNNIFISTNSYNVFLTIHSTTQYDCSYIENILNKILSFIMVLQKCTLDTKIQDFRDHLTELEKNNNNKQKEEDLRINKLLMLDCFNDVQNQLTQTNISEFW